jgi:hypothetical protein
LFAFPAGPQQFAGIEVGDDLVGAPGGDAHELVMMHLLVVAQQGAWLKSLRQSSVATDRFQIRQQ